MTLAFCWSHVRRGFYDLARTGTAPIATEALTRIAALYRIETEHPRQAAQSDRRLCARREPTAGQGTARLVRDAARQAARPQPDRGGHPLCAEPLGRAGAVPRRRPHRARHQQRRARHAARGLVEKERLFAGSDEGGANWAGIASLIETCKLNGVNPQTYFTDLLTRLVNGWPQNRIDELMPWHWTTEQPS